MLEVLKKLPMCLNPQWRVKMASTEGDPREIANEETIRWIEELTKRLVEKRIQSGVGN
jgi:hypothetical protein